MSEIFVTDSAGMLINRWTKKNCSLIWSKWTRSIAHLCVWTVHGQWTRLKLSNVN